MTDETINGGSVSLIRENEDGSADYQFNFPLEALTALTRLGILTAIQAGIGEARHLNPDEGEAIEELDDTETEQLTDEEFEALAEVYGKKETEQDIATLEKNIALMQDDELQVCVKEFFEKYLNHVEESDSGKMFNPIVVSCSRAMMTEPLNDLLAKMAELSGAKPKETYD
tara:strand:- start:2 stop:514 length:513 start_codon:yes stop_codon:yes gene_type:complete